MSRIFKPQHLQPPRGFTGPVALADGPVCLEIGAGMGKHALWFASEQPHQRLFAVERTAAKFKAFSERAQAANLSNLYPVHADALPWVVHALAPACLDEAFILYPNPEPKNPAQRWFNMPFFAFLLSRLRPGGTLTMASNIMAYVDEAEAQLQQQWRLPYVRSQVAASSERTHFEVKYLARGARCEQLVLTKPKDYVTLFDAVDYTGLKSGA
ncbi:MAG: DUF938 domain-containing protein [Neisseriaceae bacterium]|nr:DUF938 domain-containing protein [Neisseriaceae bacterium]MBP6861863.1 DUF938 domain-containing protein [Neisseriaceae bacterium]